MANSPVLLVFFISMRVFFVAGETCRNNDDISSEAQDQEGDVVSFLQSSGAKLNPGMLEIPLTASKPFAGSGKKNLSASQVIDATFSDAKSSKSQSLAGLVVHRKVGQPAGASTTVSHVGFFQRMKNALVGVIIGFILMMFSVPVLWFNEKRNAQYETLISRGEADCRDVKDGEYDPKNTNWPVHVVGHTSSVKPVEDSLFNVRFSSGVMKLSHNVEIYQWHEEKHEKTEETEKLGGGKETTTRTWYTYEKKWLSSYTNGNEFDEREGHQNKKPSGVDGCFETTTCERIELGKGFLLSDPELSQLGSGSVLGFGEKGFPDKLSCKRNSTLKFTSDAEYFYAREGGTANARDPEIGDLRVTFNWLKDGEVTVVGLQSEGIDGKGSFSPFRVIRRPICSCSGLSEEEEKEMLRQEAEKLPEAYANEATWGGLGWCFCCPCNIVAMCCAAAMHPELHHAYYGKISKTECFNRIKNSAAAMKWIIRAVGWLMMFIGLCLWFGPFTTALKVLPFIGPFLSSVGGMIVGVFSFIVTVIIAIFIVSLAYLMYHPCMGMIAFACLAAVIAGIIALTHVLGAKPHNA